MCANKNVLKAECINTWLVNLSKLCMYVQNKSVLEAGRIVFEVTRATEFDMFVIFWNMEILK